MTFLGKIITVLIFAMSLLFMGFSISIFATHKNWKVAANALQKQVQDQQRKNQQLEAEYQRSKDALAAEQAARRFAVASLRSKLQDAQSALQTRETQYATLLGNHGVLEEANRTAAVNLEKLTTENATLRNEIRTAQQDRDTQFAEVIRLTDELNRMEGVRRDLEDRRQQLMVQNAKYKLVLDAHDLDEYSTVANIPPKVDGIVLAVSSKLIEISLGSDDGLKEGHQLDVYRKNTYLGRVVIRKTAPDRAVAEVIKDYRKGTIKKGDHVATKLI